jgi:hypothetical protein
MIRTGDPPQARRSRNFVDDYLSPSLAHLLNTAQREIDWHVNDHGFCAACGSTFPCERAVLADLALSAL